uniref:Kinase suppressor of RAS SAM-like domain-containing protein n=1 Tax=Zosterops lateralis melanops TaxID=1220523 RepID=A0A8D2PLL0_ZOSLA
DKAVLDCLSWEWQCFALLWALQELESLRGAQSFALWLPQVKLIDYIHRQRQCKLSVPLSDRTAELNSYPRFNDWLDIVNVRKEVVQRIPEELTLDALLEMNESKVKETMKRCGARDEECSRLNGALSCLRKVTESGTDCLVLLWDWCPAAQDDVPMALPERRDSSCSQPDPSWSPCTPAKGSQHQQPRSTSTAPPCEPPAPSHGPCPSAETLLEALVLPAAGGRPRTPHSITVTPPATPQPKRRHRLKPPRTPPPPCRKVFQLLPNFPTLTRSKSHESQLGNRIDEVPPVK